MSESENIFGPDEPERACRESPIAFDEGRLLARVAIHVRQIQENAGVALLYVMHREAAAAEPQLREVCDIASQIAHVLVRNGVRLPSVSKRTALDLGELARLDSPEARELHRRLTDLMPLAEAVDAGRGRTMGEDYEPMPGESRGTDIAETLSLMVLRLKNETQGPRGRD